MTPEQWRVLANTLRWFVLVVVLVIFAFGANDLIHDGVLPKDQRPAGTSPATVSR